MGYPRDTIKEQRTATKGVAVSEKRLLAVAEIARALDVPESTVHYWKNRFAQYLPSVGEGRQKRFQAEAVEIFGAIAEMLRNGHTAQDVMERLAKQYPLTPSALPDQPRPVEPALPAGLGGALSLKLAQAVGAEIARAVGEGISNVLATGSLSGEDIAALRRDVENAAGRVGEQSQALESLRAENEDLKRKLEVMEAELVRLRKDRREMEKYLLDKMKSITT